MEAAQEGLERFQVAWLSALNADTDDSTAGLQAITQLYPANEAAIASGRLIPYPESERYALEEGLKRLIIVQASEALSAKQSLMTYTHAEAAHTRPFFPRLIAAILSLLTRHTVPVNTSALEPAVFARLLEEIMDLALISDAYPLVGILEQLEGMFRTVRFEVCRLTLLRTCNQLLRRLSNAHDVHLCGRILIFIAKIYPFFDKSGLNTNWFTNSGLALPIDVLQPDCLDTEGCVIDIPLYNTFWGLQITFQNRGQAMSPQAFAKAHESITYVLERFAAIPITVPAVGYSQRKEDKKSKSSSKAVAGREVTVSAVAQGSSDSVGPGAMDWTGELTAVAVAARTEEDESGRYLSSSQLFGLQLKDASFRRQFLIQCLILLHHLTVPSVKEKLAPDLVGLEDLQAKVYDSLASTPYHGKQVAAAIASVMANETMWVKWKLVSFPPAKRLKVEKVEAAPVVSPVVQAPHTALFLAKPATQAVNAVEPVDGILLPVESAEDRTAAQPEVKRRRLVLTKTQILVNNLSRLLVVSPNSMAGLAKKDRALLPDMRAFLQPVIEGLDPENDIEAEYRRCATDTTYTWRAQRLFGRTSLQACARLKGNVEALTLHTYPDLREKFGVLVDPYDAFILALDAKTKHRVQQEKAALKASAALRPLSALAATFSPAVTPAGGPAAAGTAAKPPAGPGGKAPAIPSASRASSSVLMMDADSTLVSRPSGNGGTALLSTARSKSMAHVEGSGGLEGGGAKGFMPAAGRVEREPVKPPAMRKVVPVEAPVEEQEEGEAVMMEEDGLVLNSAGHQASHQL